MTASLYQSGSVAKPDAIFASSSVARSADMMGRVALSLGEISADSSTFLELGKSREGDGTSDRETWQVTGKTKERSWSARHYLRNCRLAIERLICSID